MGQPTFGEALWVNASGDGTIIGRVDSSLQGSWSLSVVNGLLQFARCDMMCSYATG